jgi:hypothetical protein
MLLIDQPWTSTGSSGGLDAVQVPDGVTESVLYAETSTIATTQSFSLQTGLASTGPWFTEGSTALAATANVAAIAALRLTGPYKWVRPYINSASTGTYRFRLIGV